MLFTKSNRWFIIIGLSGLLSIGAFSYMIITKKMHIWLPDYLFGQTIPVQSTEITDIIFVVIDHWKPGRLVPKVNMRLVNDWMIRYRILADKHFDSDGRKVQHTFFYSIEQFAGYQVDSLVRLCHEGYGDIEIHLHHQNDTPKSLKKLLKDGIDSMQAHGALVSVDGADHFAFVHGNWSLDNSRQSNGKNYCGVNEEISILADAGCYADFTFPAMQTDAQPELVNKIYYATDNPKMRKSYSTGIQSHVGIDVGADQLMIFEGPLVINWKDWRFGFHPTIDDGDIYRDMIPSIDRFTTWMSADIRVLNGPNWVFIRPFTHGCNVELGSIDANLGEAMDNMLTEMEERYRDNDDFRLHYMTAREAYNVVKAAEAGMRGDANKYRNFVIKPYKYSVTDSIERGN